MKNITDFLKYLITRFLNAVVIILLLALALGWIFLNGIFVANVANAVRLSGYIDASIGIQIVLLILGLVWVPLYLFKMLGSWRK